MEMAFHELPLALFTTLAPIGAGAFIMLCVAFFQGKFTEAQLKAVDRWTVVPLLVALVGMACSFAHLTNPGNAMNVMATIGRTPLANEITAFGVFCALAALYWLVALAGGLKNMGARRVFALVVALAAVVFAVFVGMAYWIPAIPVWNTLWTPVLSLGIQLFGGMLCGLLVLTLARAEGGIEHGGADTTVFGLYVLGALLTLAATIAIWVMGSGSQPMLFSIAAHTGSLIALFVIFIVLVVISLPLGFFHIKIGPSTGFLVCTLVVVALACFLARLVFYGFQIGIGF